jgi:GTP-binding protein YchF
VPDERLNVLAGIFHPQRIVPAETKYIDIGASVKTLAEGKGISGQLLNDLSRVDMLLNVVREFKDDAIPHPDNSIDVKRDIGSMTLELAFSDLVIIEKRLQKIESSLKAAKAGDRPAILKEQELLSRIKKDLENDIPVREMKLTEEETRSLANYQFLTGKPLLIVVNLGEDDLPEAEAMQKELEAAFPKSRVATICGQLETELRQMDKKDADEMRKDYGLKESGLDSVLKLSYALLGLISFLTAGADECRAWPIQEGTTAVKAAGKIHSDIERGFIRAEVVTYQDLVAAGSMVEVKKRGTFRLEGKTYIVKDGDVINYLFNV